MKIIIPGGTGQVGTVLARHFHAKGHEVVVVSRNPPSLPWRTLAWTDPWAAELEGADALINLAGRSVNCRYTPANRREIMASRLESTRALGEAVMAAKIPPRVWLQASTATIYAHRFDAPNDDSTGILGGSEPNLPDTWRFSYDVANSWEKVATSFVRPETRQVLLRSAITLSPDRGGAFELLLKLVRFGLGGTNGSGRQYLSWIHDQDFVRAIEWLIERNDLAGPINVAAPQPLPNRDFMRALRQAWGMPFGLPSTEWMLTIGAFFLRTETELILKSRRVVPEKLLASGFQFQFPDWPRAARDLCLRWRS
jgi:uncharacterized protein (TIGR01777 family)